MDKLEQIKETIEESAGLLDKQQEYNFKFDEIVRIIQDNDGAFTFDNRNSLNINIDPRRYYREWKLDTDVCNYRDGWYHYRTAVSPIWTDARIRTNTQATTSGSDAVVATPRHLEEWCDFVTDDAIPF